MKKTILIAVFMLMAMFSFGQSNLHNIEMPCNKTFDCTVVCNDCTFIKYFVESGAIQVTDIWKRFEVPYRINFKYNSDSENLSISILKSDNTSRTTIFEDVKYNYNYKFKRYEFYNYDKEVLIAIIYTEEEIDLFNVLNVSIVGIVEDFE